MFKGDIDEIIHLLLAVWASGIYESQISEIREHYGVQAVEKAEDALYSSRVFQIIMGM